MHTRRRLQGKVVYQTPIIGIGCIPDTDYKDKNTGIDCIPGTYYRIGCIPDTDYRDRFYTRHRLQGYVVYQTQITKIVCIPDTDYTDSLYTRH